MKTYFAILFSHLLFFALAVSAEDSFAALCEDRMAIEHVYYDHRTGEKLPFERILSADDIRRLVQRDRARERALHQRYGLEITTAQLDAEVKRIEANTRAPQILADLKHALGNDSACFARSVARPTLVERLLRECFENDDALNAADRHRCDQIRVDLLLAKAGGAEPSQLITQLKRAESNAVSEVTWQLKPRPIGTAVDADEIEVKRRFGPDAQILSRPNPGKSNQQPCFEDLPFSLRNILARQLRHAGDISAVIEIPAGFLIYVAREKTVEALSVAMLSLPKLDYERWLDGQEEMKR